MKTRIFYFFTLLSFFTMGINLHAANVLDSDWDNVVNGNCDDQGGAWWSSAEAIRIAGNVLLYQKDIGGWEKNIDDMHRILTQSEKDALLASKTENAGATIDNGATWLELRYFSRVYAAISDSATKANIQAGFLKGIVYLIEAQYDNGGWPQFYPLRGGYSDHITYNDDAMTHAMTILMHIYLKDGTFSIPVPDSTVAHAEAAFDKGIVCILNTQYEQEGLLTTWCAQHHYNTLEPALARSYELPSLSGSESARVLQFLMSIENPSFKVRRAIYFGVNWYDDTRVEGYRVERYTNSDGLSDLRVVADGSAPDMWARFYTLESNTPFFCSRDGIKRYSLAEISYERRNNYSWYGNKGHDVFSDYSSWYAKWGSNTEQETVIMLPAVDDMLLSNNAISVKANANEYKFGSIKNFELYVDGAFVSDYKTEKIDTAFTDLGLGAHTIIVKSTDDKGYSTSDTTNFTVIQGFSLTINSGTGTGNYAEGTEVNIKADTPPSGKTFEKWTGDTLYLADVTDKTTKVTVPAGDISLTAVYKDIPSGIYNEISDLKEIRIFPNPAGSSFSIDLNKIGHSNIEIYNMHGRLVYSTYSTTSVQVIDDHYLSSGMYFIKLTDSDNSIYTQKILIE